jgi:uncharacterized protein YjiS (DUF1127 family)
MIRKMLHSMRTASRIGRELRDLREMGRMNPRLLQDIGITEADIDAAMRRLKPWI